MYWDSKEKKIEKAIFYRYLSIMGLFLLASFPFFWMILTTIFLLGSYLFLLPITSSLFIEFSTQSLIVNNNHIFAIIQACIAPSVYLLFILLFFSLPISLHKSSQLFLKASLYFTLLNFIRIVLLMYIFLIIGEKSFEALHLLFYEFLSGILTASIIIYLLHKHKIKKQYPFISDCIQLITIIKKYIK
jgi:exosortase/archaeosortase family protein